MRGPWSWAVGWAVLIEVLVLWPSPPQVAPFGLLGFDKLAHAVLFAVQAVLLARALGDQRWLWVAFVGAAAFAAFTEWQQKFILTRSMELGDFLADLVGAVFGLALFAALARGRREQHS